jgi:HlyD family secretion protein
MKKITTKILFLISILFLTACSKEVPVKVSPVTKGQIIDSVTGVNAGTVYAEQDTELAFGAVGRVQKLHVSAGSSVKKDEILAELENEDLKATVEATSRELNRLVGVKNPDAVSQRELDEAKKLFAIAKAALEKTLIRAPFNGFVAELSLEVGQLAQITAVLPKAPIRLVDEAPRYIKVQFDEVDLRKIKVGDICKIKVPAVGLTPLEGQIRSVVPFVSSLKEQDRTAEIEVTVNYENLLPVGASADVEVILNKKDDVLLVPARAVLGSLDSRYIFLIQNGKAKKQEIKTGISNYDSVEVLSGISLNEKVIIPDDRNSISDGQAVTES